MKHTCPPSVGPQLLVSVAEMTGVRRWAESWGLRGFGKGKPTSLRVLGVGSGKSGRLLGGGAICTGSGKLSRILRDGEGGEGEGST